jgi:hypothetical protein
MNGCMDYSDPVLTAFQLILSWHDAALIHRSCVTLRHAHVVMNFSMGNLLARVVGRVLIYCWEVFDAPT